MLNGTNMYYHSPEKLPYHGCSRPLGLRSLNQTCLKSE